jgi:hypothetical protein
LKVADGGGRLLADAFASEARERARLATKFNPVTRRETAVCRSRWFKMSKNRLQRKAEPES